MKFKKSDFSVSCFFAFILILITFNANEKAFSQSSIFTTISNTQGRGHFADDRQLTSGRRLRFLAPPSNNITPDAIQQIGPHNSVKLHFVRSIKNAWTPISGLPVTMANSPLKTAFIGRQALGPVTDQNGVIEFASCTAGGNVLIQLSLNNEKISVINGRLFYKISLQIPCGTEAAIQFKEDSFAGQVFGIWQVAQRAGYVLSTVSDLSFWKRKIRFSFPDSADYYNFDTVHLTLGHQWDVVAHEMGHAIYDQANIGQFGGGDHKIDECYSNELGLSEGWASFFAAWTQIALNDPNAHFEYMVPRRAPIQVEHVPADVCGKSQSEWRVFSFLWDLIDLNNDGEVSVVESKKLWDDLLGARISSIDSAYKRLQTRGWNQNELRQVWNLNFPAEPK